MRIKEYQILRKGNSILLGISLGNAVLDIQTSKAQLQECFKLLQDPDGASRLERTEMGNFGCYSVSLDVDKDGTVSLFVEGPEFEPHRSQSAAIWLLKEELRGLLSEALQEKMGKGTS